MDQRRWESSSLQKTTPLILETKTWSVDQSFLIIQWKHCLGIKFESLYEYSLNNEKEVSGLTAASAEIQLNLEKKSDMLHSVELICTRTTREG